MEFWYSLNTTRIWSRLVPIDCKSSQWLLSPGKLVVVPAQAGEGAVLWGLGPECLLHPRSGEHRHIPITRKPKAYFDNKMKKNKKCVYFDVDRIGSRWADSLEARIWNMIMIIRKCGGNVTPSLIKDFITLHALCPATHGHCRMCKTGHCVGLYQAQRWRNWSVRESRPPLADSR